MAFWLDFFRRLHYNDIRTKMIFDNNKILITCAGGLEKAVKSELFRLGFGDVPADNCSFTVNGGISDVVYLAVNLRAADRVFIQLAEFSANTFDEIFDGTHDIPFESFLPEDAKIIVDGRCGKSDVFAVSATQSVVKKAIVKRLSEKYGLIRLPETGSEYKIEFRLFKNKCKILLNAVGAGLHKRGYRDKVWIAPIKETLAAALILYSDYYRKNLFCDPFCGSGTLAIEAAMIAKNIAPGINRAFDFLKWKGFDKKVYSQVIEKAKESEFKENPNKIFASDIDAKAVKLAERHARNAGVLDLIDFNVKDVADVKLYGKGTIVSNPPYGERVIGRDAAHLCYKSLGKILPKTWSAFIITSDFSFEKFFGKKADRKRKLYNSEKECNLYYYYGKGEYND